MDRIKERDKIKLIIGVITILVIVGIVGMNIETNAIIWDEFKILENENSAILRQPEAKSQEFVNDYGSIMCGSYILALITLMVLSLVNKNNIIKFGSLGLFLFLIIGFLSFYNIPSGLLESSTITNDKNLFTLILNEFTYRYKGLIEFISGILAISSFVIFIVNLTRYKPEKGIKERMMIIKNIVISLIIANFAGAVALMI